jgi:hypothetical protein
VSCVFLLLVMQQRLGGESVRRSCRTFKKRRVMHPRTCRRLNMHLCVSRFCCKVELWSDEMKGNQGNGQDTSRTTCHSENRQISAL